MSEFLRWPGWIDLTVAACVLGLAFAASFVVRYHIRTGGAWTRTPEGRWMLWGRLLTSAVLALTLVNYFFPGYAARRFASFLLITAYAIHLWWPHLLLSRAHREHDHERDNDHGVEDEGAEHGHVRGSDGRAGMDRR